MGVKTLAAVAVVCLVVAGGCFVEASRSAGQRHLVPFRAADPTTTTPPTSTPPMPAPVAPPVSVAIPAVGLSARVVPIGLNAVGQIEMPAPVVAGWYRLGPAPGAVGPAVIVGHVDTYQGAAVFYRLTGVRTGEEIDVLRADGSHARFVISGVTEVKKTAFPSTAVFGRTSRATIRLVTCTGPFNPTSRHYVDSLIIWGVAG
jgi:Sortase domain